MDIMLQTYWREMSSLAMFVAYLIRQEMITKANARRIRGLEIKLCDEKIIKAAAFQAVTEEKLEAMEKEISQLFAFRNKGL